jgi:hypothetical protein
VKRMKRIKHLDVREVRTLGIMRDDVRIPTFTVLCPAAGCRPNTNTGSALPVASSFR